ncbi:MAG: DUF4419 domain-containing protein, partial [Eggerthellaceae bacterium]|nr:DUF4419 domain-containing protein [Eggerthellaceae bacterium]
MKKSLLAPYRKTNPLLYGYWDCFTNHQPITISPDMIWTLINISFSKYVNNHAKELRKLFVNFEGKKQLIAIIPKTKETATYKDFEAAFKQFNYQISEYTGKEIVNILTSDFSTTTEASKVVSQALIMTTMKEYFKYIGGIGCGFPFIVLEGTMEDWEKLLQKLKSLNKYGFNYYIEDVSPIIEQIIETKKGNIDKQFWLNFFKIHIENEFVRGGSMSTYMDVEYINGWFVKFFTDKDGNFIKGISTRKFYNFTEQAECDILVKDLIRRKDYDMKLNVGLFGLSFDDRTKAYKPELGWVMKEQ